MFSKFEFFDMVFDKWFNANQISGTIKKYKKKATH